MKLVIFGVIALLLGLAGGTGVAILRAPKAGAAADSLTAHRADSTVTPHAPAPAAVPAPPPAQETPPASGTIDAHAAATTHAAPVVVPPAATVHAAPPPASPVHAATSASAAPAAREGYAQVGSIFARMKPADVAQIATYLEDEHMDGVLRTLGARQAATLLEALPAERAARLSRRIIANPTPQEKR